MAHPPPDPEGRIVHNDDVKGGIEDVAENVIASGKGKILLSAADQLQSRQRETEEAA